MQLPDSYMQLLNHIAVFDNDKFFISMLKGYCYANNIAMTEVDFNREGINKVEEINPALIIIPVDLIDSANMNLETVLLRRTVVSKQIKICGLNKNTTNTTNTSGLTSWVDTIIDNPCDIGKIDGYIRKTFLLNNTITEKRQFGERRSSIERRSMQYKDIFEAAKRETSSRIQEHIRGVTGFKNFRIDQRNKCVFLKGRRVDLTPKEFELVELLLTDVDRIFMTDEIINHLWPENKRATKSDLYQYMHLLRKKIEKDPNNPQWILTVKGFGYRLNLGSGDEIHQPIIRHQLP
jgi:DNA-binding response OmpR family regulator